MLSPRSVDLVFNQMLSSECIVHDMLELNVRRIIGDCMEIAADTSAPLLGLVYSALCGNQTALDIADALLES